MKKIALATLLSAVFATQAFAKVEAAKVDDLLTGDARTACEVIMCLSSSQGRSIKECQPPLHKYFSITASGKNWKAKQLKKRRKFLDLCPAANENAKMSALTTAVQHQEYACDAGTLNSRTEKRRNWIRRSSDDGGSYSRRLIRTQTYIPDFCQKLYDHEFTEYSQIKKPKFTCDANKWYSESDWNRGFERVEVSRKWNSRTDSYDVVYKDVPIKKDCWE